MNTFFRQVYDFVVETIKVVLISLVIIIPIRYFLVQPFFVVGASMEPNFETGDYLIIDELSYFLRGPHREEVVVFHPPFTDETRRRQYYIKRVIGLPGETVRIQDGKIFIINNERPEGFFLEEEYPTKGFTNVSGGRSWTLGENEFFVLGDHRNESADSRFFGAVPRDNIVGRAWIRAFPFGKLDLLTNN